MSESQQAGKPLSQRQEQLDRHIAARVDDLLRSLHERVGEQVRAASQELLHRLESQMPELPSFVADFDLSQLLEAPPSPAPAAGGVGEVLDAVAVVDGKADQAEIVTALLEEGRRFASRTAFFLVRHGQVRGWAGRGYDEDRTASYSGAADASPWAEMVTSKTAVALDAEAAAGVAGSLGGDAEAALIVPFSIRGSISGALWAERPAGARLDVASLQLLTHAAAMALETAAVSPGLSPALRLEGEVAFATTEMPPTVEEPSAVEDSAPAAGAASVQAAPPPVEAAESEAAEPSYEVAPSTVVEPAPEPVVDSVSEEVPSGDAVPEVTAPVATTAVEEAVAEEASETLDEAQTEHVAVEEEAPAESDLPTDDEIALEAEPEPELEDTNIWELEEDDDEPTQVGMARVVEEEAEEPAPEAPSPEVQPPVEAPIGQETVRIDLATVQQDAAARAGAVDAAQPSEDPGDETSPTMHAMPPVASPSAEPEPPPSPAEPSPPAESSQPAEPAESEAEPAPSSFAEPASPASFPASPSSFAEPEAAEPAPSEVPPPSGFTSPPAQPEPAEEEKPDAVGGSTEVVPPPDLDGPGLAFATPEPEAAEERVNEGDAALHEEARRLARLLVSEIKLYNEEIIEEGRRSGNIYERLKDDIDRSRQMYEERIDPRLADQEDYFYQELVQRLAGGEEKLLGM